MRRAESVYGERDAAENRALLPPDGETIAWPCMWMTELYAPSHTAALAKGLRKLEGGNTSSMQGGDPAEWLQGVRSQPWAYRNLGEFRSRSARSSIRNEVDLPEGFDSIHVELKQVSGGITICAAL